MRWAWAVVLAGCAAQVQEYEEVRVPGVDQGKVVAGTWEELVEIMGEGGASNMVVGHGLCEDGEIIDVVVGDYFRHAWVFMGGKYWGKVKIPGVVHPVVKVVRAGEGSGIVIFGDVMRVGGKDAGLLVTFGKGGVGASAALPVAALKKRHGGMRDVYIGGTDLGDGLIVTARDADGNAWTKVYRVWLEGKKVGIEEISYEKAWGCSCFEDWLNGKDGRELFGEVVE